MTKPELSVVIPVLNEAAALPTLIDSILSQADIELEIIVGDGGSNDGSQQIAAKAGALVVSSPRGRGRQMNAAAAAAKGDLLLFLHADSTIDDEHLFATAVSFWQRECARRQRPDVVGHFPLRFVRAFGKNRFAYRFLEEKTTLNRVNTTNGDQGFLLSRNHFKKLGGFAEELPVLEDQELAERIRKDGVWITLPGFLKTSARRFERQGFHRCYILMSILMGCYSVGKNPFLERAPHIYKAQHETGRLRVAPFLWVVWKMMFKDMGFLGSLKFWMRMGKYVKENAWQLFFLVDVLCRRRLGPGRFPFLKFYDRAVRPALNFVVFDAITGLLTFIWYMLVLAPFFRLQESMASALL